MNIIDTIKKIRNEAAPDIDFRNTNKYRVMVKENSGFSAYYFSVPIYRDSDRKLIDFTWRQEDCKTVFQGINADVQISNDRITLKNKYGHAVLTFESDIEIEPTFNGVAIHSLSEKTVFNLKFDNEYNIKENGNYFALMLDDYTPFLVVNGIYGKIGNKFYPLNINVAKISDKDYQITVENFGRIPCDMLFEIDLHSEKMIFDTTVESKNADKNNAFGGTAFLGKTEEFGEQWLYSRFDVIQLIDLNCHIVKEANLYLPKFSEDSNVLESYKMTAPWCSFGSTWNTKTAFSELLHRARLNKKYEIAEVSDVVRDILRLNEPRNPGIVIKGTDTNGYTVVSTGDNYLSPQILEIKLKNN